MTLRSSFSDNKRRSFFQQLTMQRKWITMMVSMIALVYYPLCTLILIMHQQELSSYWSSVKEQKIQLLNVVSAWIGLRSYAVIPVGVIAFIIALQGFHYLTDARMMDLMGSLPYKKLKVFRNVYGNGFYLFALPWAISMVLSLLVAALMGAFNQALVLDVIYGFLVCCFLFLFIYSVTVLACVVTGRTIIAAAVALVMFFIEPVIELIFNAYTSVFFKTYYYTNFELVLNGVSPLTRLLGRIRDVRWNAWDMSFQNVHGSMAMLAFPLFLCGIFAVAATLLSALCYQKRREECSGMAFAFPIVRSIVKILCSVLSCLCVTILVITFFEKPCSMYTTVISIIAILVTGVITSILLEVIMDLNINAGRQHLWQMGIAIVLSLGIYGTFRMDLTGYDSYLPDAEDVESYAFFSEGNTSISDYYVDGDSTVYDVSANYWTVRDYFENHMYLTNVEDLLKVVEQSQEYMNANPLDYADRGFNFTVIYRLKSGKTVYRSIVIDPDMDPTLLDNIMGTDEYHEGAYVYFNNDSVNNADSVSLTFQNGCITKSILGADSYEEFISNYRKDLVLYNYSLATSEDAIGSLDVMLVTGSGDSSSTTTASYEIYPSYTNTINFLKAYGLYDEDYLTSKYIRTVYLNIYGQDGTQEYYEINDADTIDALSPYMKSNYAGLYFNTGTTEADTYTYDVMVTVEMENSNGVLVSTDGSVEIRSSDLDYDTLMDIINQ